MNMNSDKYIKRDMEGLVLSLSEEYSCVLVSGPRQVGKSTMLKHIMKCPSICYWPHLFYATDTDQHKKPIQKLQSVCF